MVKSKSTCPKWHFGQVGHRGKKTIMGGFFLLKFLVKKVGISCSACVGITKVNMLVELSYVLGGKGIIKVCVI
jgi:hypothetical protein